MTMNLTEPSSIDRAIPFRLLFVDTNYNNTVVEFKPSMLVKDIKALIIEKYPSSLPAEGVERLRLICSGQELDDTKTLEEMKLAVCEGDERTCIHVVPVRFTQKKKELGLNCTGCVIF
eukprot:Filipodium_phascolosomae@DN4331_c0_g1_i1.p1